MEATTESEESISLEDTLESLKRNAKAVDVYFHESRKKLKEFQKKYTSESQPFHELPLQPRTRLMKWLTDRDMSVESSFHEFLEAFLEEHANENLLDLSERTIACNSAACILLGQPQGHVLTIFELIALTESLYS